MSKDIGQTTAPGRGTTSEDAGDTPWLALVIAWSASQPHRAGEIAFFPLNERLYVGRGDIEIEKFAQFVRQRPGEIAAVDPREGVLAGGTVSKRQLTVRFVGDGLEVENIGKCRMDINGTECSKGILRPGDTLRLKGEVVLLCVSRPRVLRAPRLQSGPFAFGEPDPNGIVGESEAAYRMRAQLESAARGYHDVLILGESGAGKELAAQIMHHRSSRARGPLIASNASALTPTLVAWELFGNAANCPNPGPARKGLLGEANRGTLYFDEIGDLELAAQAQLLRVMAEREYQQVGEGIARRVDVRFVGATNRDVTDEEVFRLDFLARFMTRIRLPPLRERREDIPLLVRHFLLQHAQKDSKFEKRFCRQGIDGRLDPNVSGRLIDELLRHPLPANARDLQTLLNEAIEVSEAGERNELRPPKGGWKVIAPPEVKAEKKAAPERAPRAPKAAQGFTEADLQRREEILRFLAECEGNVSLAARRMKMERTALRRLMEKLEIEWEPQDSEE